MSYAKDILGLIKYYVNGFSSILQYSALYCIDIVSSGFKLFCEFLQFCEFLKYWASFIYKAL